MYWCQTGGQAEVLGHCRRQIEQCGVFSSTININLTFWLGYLQDSPLLFSISAKNTVGHYIELILRTMYFKNEYVQLSKELFIPA